MIIVFFQFSELNCALESYFSSTDASTWTRTRFAALWMSFQLRHDPLQVIASFTHDSCLRREPPTGRSYVGTVDLANSLTHDGDTSRSRTRFSIRTQTIGSRALQVIFSQKWVRPENDVNDDDDDHDDGHEKCKAAAS